MEEKEVTKNELRIEQCKKIIEGLKSQNSQLIYQLQNINLNNMFKRLDYLFKVLDSSEMFDKDFVNQCISEIKSLMTIHEEDDIKEDGTEEDTDKK